MKASNETPESLRHLPLICHVIYRFDYGGLENGLVNVINATQGQQFRHCIIALTEATEFRRRLKSEDVQVYELKKKPGKDFGAYYRFYRLMRALKPSILHTRNIGTIDCAAIAWLAGVPYRIHGEHGWDVYDIDGTNRKYRIIRKTLKNIINQFVTVSSELMTWLMDSAKIHARKVMQICNGVDTERFSPLENARRNGEIAARFSDDVVVIGSVLRFQDIKDPMNLVRAFGFAYEQAAETKTQLRLVMIGDGPLRATALSYLDAAGLSNVAWLPGSRDDVSEILRSIDVFVLGSRREGISNTLLEAMACGIPVIATKTGGNIELVRCGETGSLVDPENATALAEEILCYANDETMRTNFGAAAREHVVASYSLQGMIDQYRNLYSNAIAMVTD